MRGSVRFRVGRKVYVACFDDDTVMGCAFPRAERGMLVTSEPGTFVMPRPSGLRFPWVGVR